MLVEIIELKVMADAPILFPVCMCLSSYLKGE